MLSAFLLQTGGGWSHLLALCPVERTRRLSRLLGGSGLTDTLFLLELAREFCGFSPAKKTGTSPAFKARKRWCFRQANGV